jgi:hypothetical protein
VIRRAIQHTGRFRCTKGEGIAEVRIIPHREWPACPKAVATRPVVPEWARQKHLGLR